jgi:U3 small nucleolar RNA-associated protein 6
MNPLIPVSRNCIHLYPQVISFQTIWGSEITDQSSPTLDARLSTAMTETLEFRLEQSLPELQDLVHKELFTQDEVKAIIQKRTQYEHTLLRRNAKKADFLRYTEYEMNLEALRKKRQKRSSNAPSISFSNSEKPGRKTISDYAGPKRIGNIFKRATTRFHDIGLWLAYIEFSKLQGSPKLVGKLFGEFVLCGVFLI